MNTSDRSSVRGWGAVVRNWLYQEFKLDWILWSAAFAFLCWVNILFLFHVGATTVEELRWIYLSATFHTALVIASLLLVVGIVDALNWKPARFACDALLFLMLACYFLDYLLFRMLSIHLFKAIGGHLQGGFREFLITLEISGIPPWKLRLCGLSFLVLPACGALLCCWTRRASKHAPVAIRPAHLLTFLVVGLGGLIAESAYASSPAGVNVWLKCQHVMPLSLSFARFPEGRSYPVRVRPMKPEQTGAEMISKLPLPANKPDIFLFILESVRADFLDEQIAPNLARFKAENFSVRETVSAANATHLSWFSIFSAQFPFYYRASKDNPERWGSWPLRALQRMGYSIHVLSASYLSYCGLDQLIFGPGRSIANSCVIGPKAPEGDRQVNRLLLEQLKTGSQRGGRVFIIFYESTHHDYDWPSDYPAKFEPYVSSWSYLQLSDKDLPKIKNRYKNSLNFVDHQFGQIISTLKDMNLYDDSIVAVTADHGEEFREFGNMVHANALNHIQTSVPLYFHFPQSEKLREWPGQELPVASHIDLMPTVLDYLGVPEALLTHLDGASIFRQKQRFILSAAQNWEAVPYQFFVHNGSHKAFFRFSQERIRLESEYKLYLYDVTDDRDRPVSPAVALNELGPMVEREFGSALRRFFEVQAGSD